MAHGAVKPYPGLKYLIREFGHEITCKLIHFSLTIIFFSYLQFFLVNYHFLVTYPVTNCRTYFRCFLMIVVG